ncbi:sensor histidine kinase [Paenarthrobacter sp. PH39-S1]|uniref:sensor histidine kinase n=1 Tax=Paenarthrobacter sp. PH39-S1 TaxID=3046204 RepID=UPI0024B937B8|nr:sensor histidine kinase [Paenarthrobacter sp. PH39-S1]MDJ0357717.1 sensor histidine kinase [Paenarthrobacter sp. PH39-S1]
MKEPVVYIHDWSIARRLFAVNVLFVLALTVFVTTAGFVDARDQAYRQAEDRIMSIAATVADNPLVLTAAASPDPSGELQPYAVKVMAEAKADFVTIMAPDRTRWTHPDPAEIGRLYIGSVDQALAGHAYTEVTAGTLGPSVRAIVPVKDGAGNVRALVAAGVTVTNVEIAFTSSLPAVVGIALVLLLGGSLAAWLLGRYLRKVTLGWGPERLGQLFVYYESVLHSVRDGLVLTDRNGELVMYNDQAAMLLGIPVPSENGPAPKLAELDLPPSLEELLRSGRTARDELHLTSDRLLVVSQEPARSPGSDAEPLPIRRTNPGMRASRGTRTNRGLRTSRVRRADQGSGAVGIGTVATVQDHTVMAELGDELRSTQTLTDALRAQTHEHSNRIHTLVSLLELGRTGQALEFATADLQLSQRLADEVLNAADEPVLSALLMGKIAQASERGIELRISTETRTQFSGLRAHDAVTILGNLLDNAMDAAADGAEPRWVALHLGPTADGLELEVSDSGPGLDAAQAASVLAKGFSTKHSGGAGRGIGLALVRQTVQRLGGRLIIGPRGNGPQVEGSPAAGNSGAVFTVLLPADTTGTESGTGSGTGPGTGPGTEQPAGQPDAREQP